MASFMIKFTIFSSKLDSQSNFDKKSVQMLKGSFVKK